MKDSEYLFFTELVTTGGPAIISEMNHSLNKWRGAKYGGKHYSDLLNLLTNQPVFEYKDMLIFDKEDELYLIYKNSSEILVTENFMDYKNFIKIDKSNIQIVKKIKKIEISKIAIFDSTIPILQYISKMSESVCNTWQNGDLPDIYISSDDYKGISEAFHVLININNESINGILLK